MNKSSDWWKAGLLVLVVLCIFALHVVQQGGFRLGMLPALLFWVLITPFIWGLSGKMPLTGATALVSIAGQFLMAALVLIAFTIYLLVLQSLQQQPSTMETIRQQLPSSVVRQAPLALFLYGSTTLIAYMLRLFGREKEPATKKIYDNSILIKTSFGYVLVEIESFQYVKGGGRRIMFHTGRSTPLNRERVRIRAGELVDEKRYRPDRRIVIDLAKIRRAIKRGDNDYVFFIGFSHEIKLNNEMYRKLGGWLPRPVLSQNPVEKI